MNDENKNSLGGFINSLNNGQTNVQSRNDNNERVNPSIAKKGLFGCLGCFGLIIVVIFLFSACGMLLQNNDEPKNHKHEAINTSVKEPTRKPSKTEEYNKPSKSKEQDPNKQIITAENGEQYTKAEQDYMVAFGETLVLYEVPIGDIALLLNDPHLNDPTWNQKFLKDATNLGLAKKNIDSLKPPKRLVEIHNDLKQAIIHANNAVDYFYQSRDALFRQQDQEAFLNLFDKKMMPEFKSSIQFDTKLKKDIENFK